MLRWTLGSAALTAAISLSACGAPEIDAINADVILGDECFYTLAERPDDCFERAPCMWSDADLHIREDDSGGFHLEAGPGGWDVRSERAERTARASASSPEELARQLPGLLVALHDTPPPVSQACVSMNPDQGMLFGDVVAFHKALTAQHVRRVGLFAALAEEE